MKVTGITTVRNEADIIATLTYQPARGFDTPLQPPAGAGEVHAVHDQVRQALRGPGA